MIVNTFILFFDIKVTHPNAPSYTYTTYRQNEHAVVYSPGFIRRRKIRRGRATGEL